MFVLKEDVEHGLLQIYMQKRENQWVEVVPSLGSPLNLADVVDPKIYLIVKKLNNIGLTTQFSCAGIGSYLAGGKKRHLLRKGIDGSSIFAAPHVLFGPSVTTHPLMDRLLHLVVDNNIFVCSSIPSDVKHCYPMWRRSQLSKKTKDYYLFDIEHLVYYSRLPFVKANEVIRININFTEDVRNYYEYLYDNAKDHKEKRLLRERYRRKVVKWLSVMNNIVDEFCLKD